jgi:hypothetical protein
VKTRKNLFERGVLSKSEMNETIECLFSVSAHKRGNLVNEKPFGLASLVAATVRFVRAASQELPA